MKFKIYTLLYSEIILILTAIGLVVAYRKLVFPSMWLGFVYVVVWVFVFVVAADFFVAGGKLSGKQFLSLTFGIIFVSSTFAYSSWIIATPKWSFLISTDKSTYSLGENVTITACLKNIGFITHSFKSGCNIPIVISIEYQYGDYYLHRHEVWYSPYRWEETVYSVGPNQILQRIFVWNQTDAFHPGEEIELGTYSIVAVLPWDVSTKISGRVWDWGRTSINITST